MLSAIVISSIEPLAPDRLFNIGPLPITNSMLFGIITALIVVGLFVAAMRLSRLWPKSRFAFVMETLVELMLSIATDSFGDRKRALRFFPLLVTLFTLILAANLSGILPGVGSTLTYNNGAEHVSFLRSYTTDLNSTLAMAVFSLTIVQIYAFRELGLGGRFRYYFTTQWYKPGKIFIGINELFSETLRLVTLSLRLFGVIYGGEALLAAFLDLAGNFAWAAMLPIMFLEIFFSIVQAYLFMMLTSTYLVMSVSHGDEHESAGAKSAEATA